MRHTLVSALVVLTWSASASADTRFGLGLGALTGDDGYRGVDNGVDVLPLVSINSANYYFFATQFGYEVGRFNGVEVTVLADYRTDGFEAGDSTFLTGMADRTGTLELGLELEYSTDLGDFSLAMLSDVLDEHEGHEISATYSLPIVLRSSQLTPFISVTHQSDDLVNYYYGVQSTEATSTRSAYEGSATTNYEIGVQSRWQSGEHHQILTQISYETWGDAITNSPLIESDGGVQAVVGYVYVF